MMRFKPSLLTLALVAAGASMHTYAADDTTAQSTATKDENIEVIQVTGIRRSLQESQSLKMSSSSIVEAISAEDIGKLPDVSIAESLARLPGVSAQRLDGRANVISIRGMGPDFTTATLNGREQASVNDNRSVEFDQYPSELLNRVVVYKTPDASVMAQAIGGTVDMQTISPLSHGEQTIAVAVRGEMNDLGALNSGSDDKGYRGSISYIDQFADDTLGVAIGYARMMSPNQEERWQAWGYPDNANGDSVLGGAKPFVRSSELERDGLLAVVEYAPNDRFHSTLDVYYSKFVDDQRLRGIEIPAAWGTNGGVVATTTVDGLVTEGVIKGAEVVVRNDVNKRDADSLSLGWNNKFSVNDSWNLEADVSLSKANRTDIGMESYSGTGRGTGVGAVDDLSFAYNGKGGYVFDHNLDYADKNVIKLGDPLGWGSPLGANTQDGFINKPEIEDELKSFRLSAEYVLDGGAIRSVEFGVNRTDRDKTKVDKGYYLTLKGYDGSADYTMTVPDQYLLDPTSLAFFGMGDVLSYDSLAFYNDGNYIETDVADVDLSRATNSWAVQEEVTTGYVLANLESEVFGIPFTGNAGLQAVYTDQSSDGTVATVEAGKVILTPRTAGDSYVEWLPSLNLSFEVADSQVVRFAAARTLTRSRMDKMNANLNYSYTANPSSGNLNWNGNAGNPELRPWLARQYDLGYENYFSDQGYFSVAVFYKDLENYVYNQFTEFDFSTLFPQKPTDNPIGNIDQPQNGEGGYVQGIEAAVSVDFGMFADVLGGFGTVLSGSYNDSEVKETPSSEPTTLPGLSEKTFNATVYYENSGFEARISSRYRSDFLGEVTKISLQRENVNIKAETVVDAQVSYDFSESGIESLYGLSVLFQVNNLTNEPFTSYFGSDQRLVRDYQNYGRNFMLGANYKF
ncbi:TonB-dependent receptor [Shewanella xiamenensis]|uniref:TonB-dependent receptor n=1 Tax=Shewanella xiamenensis TaxID=332186 RepID=UPI0024A62616|nr:TonB-dependent receptor [Shewanella xiamenensis]MDI5837408.1 TonB-dependent receptor [Shewanella xiamenensis]MDI5840383.1 TonB-dependent receptor [Shewanella xiamenensis]MDI5844384.1 TonB-dependent receptor [Shewanella xiamenensis]MDI5848026.1 TonB-dependent receptor [Shewanella xiamenensis]MDI5852318.1 TonB-dependent receptor [Shewanella xiamenensis]